MSTPAEREAARLRKRAQRERERAAKGPVEELTVHVFWEKNREVANQDHIAELRERQERVFDLLSWMEEAINGTLPPETDELFVSVEEGSADLAVFVKEHGECAMEVYLLEFWKSPNTFAALMQSEKVNAATKAFVRFGLVTGIPAYRLHEWDTWYASQQPSTNPQRAIYTTLQCVNHEVCRAHPVSVQQEILDGYQKLDKPFLCHNCIRREDSSRAQASPRITSHLSAGLLSGVKSSIESDPDQIFDSWDRVKL
jgi:hypothetical protein